MNNLIVYKSNTGFTKEYAEMLERRIGADLKPISKLSKKDIKEHENIFFGGPLRNNVILGLDKFLKHYNKMEGKNIFIFAVGIEPQTDDKKENVITANGLDLYHVRLYFLQGGLDISKMGFFQRKMMSMGLKLASEKEGISADLINQRFSEPINYVNSSNLDRMVDVYRRVTISK